MLLVIKIESYVILPQKSFVFFKHIKIRSLESPEATLVSDAVLFLPPAAISLSLYEVLIINSYYFVCNERRGWSIASVNKFLNPAV